MKVSSNALKIIRQKSQSPENEHVDDEQKIRMPKQKNAPMLLRKSVSPPSGEAGGMNYKLVNQKLSVLKAQNGK